MKQKLIDQLIHRAGARFGGDGINYDGFAPSKFAELIVRECINKIETYHIPVGNSAAGEMACGMTYSALKEIRDEIKELFRVEYPSVT